MRQNPELNAIVRQRWTAASPAVAVPVLTQREALAAGADRAKLDRIPSAQIARADGFSKYPSKYLMPAGLLRQEWRRAKSQVTVCQIL